ncbi:MAG: hypothetical protein NC831_00355 [Candidatus Omnitrophica bacterium]|nr:hypothetical protein [Candidatus Omnitrophota bacterium]MCM8829370.1 hypothetical protein [Candidatus Omnitrophota bacterium]
MKIVFAGFKGTWRKETAIILAKRLGRQLIDVEHIIEQLEKDRIAHISQVKGIEYLRNIESKIIEQYALYENCLISVGPDAISCEKSRYSLKNNGIIIWFTAEPAVILLRLHPEKESKTLIKKQHALAYMRQMIRDHDFSRFADRIIDTSALSVDETVDSVQRMLASF